MNNIENNFKRNFNKNHMLPVVCVLVLVMIIGIAFSAKNWSKSGKDDSGSTGASGNASASGNDESGSDAPDKLSFLHKECLGEGNGTYDITDAIKDCDGVTAAIVDEENVAVVGQELTEDTVTTVVYDLNLTTGKLTKCASNSYDRKEYVMYGVSQYTIASENPLVVKDAYGNLTNIYPDLSEDGKCITLDSTGDITFVRVDTKASDNIQKFYYMDNRTFIIKECELKEDGTLMENEIYEPDGYLGGYRLLDVSDGNIIFTAYERATGRYLKLIYDIEGKCISKAYDMEQSQTDIADTALQPLIITMTDDGSRISKLEIRESGLTEGSSLAEDIYDEDDLSEPNIYEENNMSESTIPEEIIYGDVNDNASKIEEKYGINIFVGDNIISQTDLYQLSSTTNEEQLQKALDTISEVLGGYPEGMLDKIKDKTYAGINIYLVGRMNNPMAAYESGVVADAAGESYADGEYYNIAIVTSEDVKTVLSHEIVHMVDQYITNIGGGLELDSNWESFNPEGFNYDENYLNSDDATGNGLVGTYFASTYGMTRLTEDKASLLENISWWDEESLKDIDSEYIRGKALAFAKAAKELTLKK